MLFQGYNCSISQKQTASLVKGLFMKELKKEQLEKIAAGAKAGRVPSPEEAIEHLLERRTLCPHCGKDIALYAKYQQSEPYPGWNNTLHYIFDCDHHVAGISVYYQDEDRWDVEDHY